MTPDIPRVQPTGGSGSGIRLANGAHAPCFPRFDVDAETAWLAMDASHATVW